MLARMARRCLALGFVALLVVVSTVGPVSGYGQDEARKVKTKVQPRYPELAKRMNLSGTVKIQVTVTPNGIAKTTKPVGGNPVLIEAAVEALKKWRWEDAPAETTEVVEFRFVPNE